MLRTNLLFWSGICLFCVAQFDERLDAKEPRDSHAEPPRSVDLFEAMESGEIEAELIAPSAQQICLRVTNKSTQPLTVQLPKTFGALPILAQFQPGGGGMGMPWGGAGQGQFGQPGGQFGPLGGLGQFGQGQFGQGGPGGGGTQGLGGGFGQGNQFGNQFGNQMGNQFGNQGNAFGNQGNGMGRGFFRVMPGRVGKIMAQTVCLEHGKPDPTSRHKYRIVPIDQMPQADGRVTEVCRLLGERLISQNVAQAAAWHLTDGLSWEQLASKNRSESRYTGNVKFFSASELESARLLLEQLEQHELPTRHESPGQLGASAQSSSSKFVRN